MTLAAVLCCAMSRPLLRNDNDSADLLYQRQGQVRLYH